MDQKEIGTQIRQLQELQRLSSIYEELQRMSFVLPVSAERPIPSMTAVLPEDDGTELVINHSFLPIPDETAVHTWFFQFYTVLDVPGNGLERGLLLESLCALNDYIPVGRCTPIDSDNESGQSVGLRWILSWPAERPVIREVFLESLVMFDGAGALVRHVLQQLTDGRTLEEALKSLV